MEEATRLSDTMRGNLLYRLDHDTEKLENLNIDFNGTAWEESDHGLNYLGYNFERDLKALNIAKTILRSST